MSKKIIITSYRAAWIKFKKTVYYKQVSDRFKGLGIKQPYRDNIIMGIFAAGWNSGNPKNEIIELKS